MIVTVTPNPSVDWTLEIASLTRGLVHRIAGEHHEPSGKGVNVTRALNVNGVPSLAVFPLGGSEGAEMEALLVAEQVLEALPSLLEPDQRQSQLDDGVTDDVERPVVVDQSKC